MIALLKIDPRPYRRRQPNSLRIATVRFLLTKYQNNVHGSKRELVQALIRHFAANVIQMRFRKRRKMPSLEVIRIDTCPFTMDIVPIEDAYVYSARNDLEFIYNLDSLYEFVKGNKFFEPQTRILFPLKHVIGMHNTFTYSKYAYFAHVHTHYGESIVDVYIQQHLDPISLEFNETFKAMVMLACSTNLSQITTGNCVRSLFVRYLTLFHLTPIEHVFEIVAYHMSFLHKFDKIPVPHYTVWMYLIKLIQINCHRR
jgi:hypothetical protein